MNLQTTQSGYFYGLGPRKFPSICDVERVKRDIVTVQI